MHDQLGKAQTKIGAIYVSSRIVADLYLDHTTVFRRLAKRTSPVGPAASPRKIIRRRRKAAGGRVGAHPEVSRGRLTQGAQTQRERYARPKNEPPGESPPRQLWRQSIQTSRIQGKWAHFFVTTVSGFFWTLRKKLKYKKLKQILEEKNSSKLFKNSIFRDC